MRLEVRYPSGSHHEVELSGTVAVVGRDPSCDLVLNDAKCSRRHAVLEAGPQGIAVRDAGSANGIYVNGQKVERAGLKDGDLIRLGEVILKVLPEEMPGTLVMAPEEMEEAMKGEAGPPPVPAAPPPPAARPLPMATLPPSSPTPPTPPVRPVAPPPPPPRPVAAPRPVAPPPPPPPPSPRPAPTPARRAMPGRPLGVTILAGLWALGVLAYPASGLASGLSGGWHGLPSALAVAVGLFLALCSLVMTFGLAKGSGWARMLQIGFAILGLFTCAFTLASAVILAYMLRKSTAAWFGGPPVAEDPGSSEMLFGAAIVGLSGLPMVAGLLASLLGVNVPVPGHGGAASGPAASVDMVRLKALVVAEQNFSAGTCGAFSDLEGLLTPAAVIPNYPPSGPSFLEAAYAAREAGGYYYDLSVEEPAAPSDGCPARSFHSFYYSATPVSGTGKGYVIDSKGNVHVADGRPASLSDPIVP